MQRFARIALGCLIALSTATCSTTQSAESESSNETTKSAEQTSEPSEEVTSSASDEAASAGETSEGSSLVEALPNGARPFDGIITAAQPTREHFQKLASSDVKTVINFRSPKENGTWDEAKMADEMGLNYVQIVIRGPSDLNRDNVEKFDRVLREKEGPFLVHCGSSNRVGAMFALRAHWLHDKSPEEAMQIGMRAGLSSLQSAVRQKLHDPESRQ